MHTKSIQSQQSFWMITSGMIAIILGGGLSAFLAKSPSTLVMWASAYLVLVVGVAQMIFGLCLSKLSQVHSTLLLWVSLALYNLASAAVILGRVYKLSSYGPLLIIAGAIGVIVAVIAMLWSIRGAAKSLWLIGFYIVALILLISAPIGMFLSRR